MADDKKPLGADTEDGSAVAIAWVGHQQDRAHIRTLSRSDWENVGVDHDGVTWDTTNRLTKGQAFVSPKAAEFLLEVEQGFAKVEDKDLAFALRSKK
jgi:hypothetical protein